MQGRLRINGTWLFAVALLGLTLSVADYMAFLRLKPEVAAIALIANKPDFEDHVVNVHHRAAERARGAADSFLPIYDAQDPGFFMVVAELYTRAGAQRAGPLAGVDDHRRSVGERH